MHLADRHELPDGYRARPYRGADDHPSMVDVLIAHRAHVGDDELPTLEQFDSTYAHLYDCDPGQDVVLIESADQVVGYGRTSRSGGDEQGRLDCVVFAPLRPDHLAPELFVPMVTAQEEHMRPWAESFVGTSRYLAYAAHPGPDRPPTGEAAWLEANGYDVVEWGATLVRPHLDDIPDLSLPDGVEVRPVSPDQIRRIWEVHHEAFRGEWDFVEATPETIDAMVAEPYSDHTLWKVAWAGDEIVGQVKSFVNPVENTAHGVARGYTEYISTHRDWRNRGIAGALLAMSLRELRDRGMSEAALGVDTNNPGGAFQLYTKLGFELRAHQAVYARAIG